MKKANPVKQKQLTTTAKGCIITFLTQRGNTMKRSSAKL